MTSTYLGGGIYQVTPAQKEEFWALVRRLMDKDEELSSEDAQELAYQRLGVCPDCNGWEG